MPSSRAAAVTRVVHSERDWRLFCRRSRQEQLPAFITACLATRYALPRRPRNPLACLRTFLWRARAVTPRLTLGMARSLRRVRQHAAHCLQVGEVHRAALAHLALPLGRLLGEDVALVGAAPLDAAARADGEALRSAPFRLHLGHDYSLLCFSLTPGGPLRGRFNSHGHHLFTAVR